MPFWLNYKYIFLFVVFIFDVYSWHRTYEIIISNSNKLGTHETRHSLLLQIICRMDNLQADILTPTERNLQKKAVFYSRKRLSECVFLWLFFFLYSSFASSCPLQTNTFLSPLYSLQTNFNSVMKYHVWSTLTRSLF